MMSPFLVIKAARLAVYFIVRCHIEVFHTVMCSALTLPFERTEVFVT